MTTSKQILARIDFLLALNEIKNIRSGLNELREDVVENQRVEESPINSDLKMWLQNKLGNDYNVAFNYDKDLILINTPNKVITGQIVRLGVKYEDGWFWLTDCERILCRYDEAYKLEYENVSEYLAHFEKFAKAFDINSNISEHFTCTNSHTIILEQVKRMEAFILSSVNSWIILNGME